MTFPTRLLFYSIWRVGEAGCDRNFLASHAVGGADFNTIKNHGKNIDSWMSRIGGSAKEAPPVEIIRSAFLPSESGITPYESMKDSITFLDQSSERFNNSKTSEDKANATKAKDMSDTLKRVVLALDPKPAAPAKSKEGFN